MRIWSLHPSLLDSKGLVACWRETLLAQKVLRGLTKGYKNHPQLDRFKEHHDPLAAITTYLHGLADEADRRGFNFDRSRIVQEPTADLPLIPVPRGQVAYELEFLQHKVENRDPEWFTSTLQQLIEPKIHPIFHLIEGEIEPWEKVKEIDSKKNS